MARLLEVAHLHLIVGRSYRLRRGKPLLNRFFFLYLLYRQSYQWTKVTPLTVIRSFSGSSSDQRLP